MTSYCSSIQATAHLLAKSHGCVSHHEVYAHLPHDWSALEVHSLKPESQYANQSSFLHSACKPSALKKFQTSSFTELSAADPPELCITRKMFRAGLHEQLAKYVEVLP